MVVHLCSNVDHQNVMFIHYLFILLSVIPGVVVLQGHANSCRHYTGRKKTTRWVCLIEKIQVNRK